MKKQEMVVGLGVMSLLLLLAAGCGGGGGGGNGGGGSGGGNTVTAAITGAAFVAVQDGKTGAWQRLSGSGPNYNFTVNSADGRYSIVWVCEGDKPRVNIIHATTAETRTIAASCATTPSGTISVAGTVQGLGSGQGAIVAIGSSTGAATSNGGSFSLSVVPGAYDLIAVRFNTSGLVPNKVWLERNRNFSSSTSGLLIDFNQADGSTVRVFDVSAGSLSISGADVGETVLTRVALQSSGRASLIAFGNTTSVNYPIFPSSVLTAGESIRFSIETDRGRGQISAVSSVPNSLSITLPPPFDSPDISFSTSGAVTATVIWSAYAETPVRGYNLLLGGDAQQRSWDITITAGWLGSETRYTSPVLNTLSGWDSARWDLQRGRPVDANFTVYVSNATPQQLLEFVRTRILPAGTQVRFATRSVTSTP
jgi:hypothetical protein